MPKKWNDAAHDFFHCHVGKSNGVSKHVVFFGNMTVQSSPTSCKLKHVAEGAKHLETNHVRFGAFKPHCQVRTNEDVKWDDLPEDEEDLSKHHWSVSRNFWQGNEQCETMCFKSKCI